jgi:hypothetical protein
MRQELSLKCLVVCVAVGLWFDVQGAPAALPEVSGVELQPLVAQVKRLTEALEYLGAPLSPEKQQALEAAMAMSDEHAATRSIQEILDPQCLISLTINPEMRVKVTPGPAEPLLPEQGWRTFLIKVQKILADGQLRGVSFEVRVERSSWVALRILASSHTNPIFVLVGDRPIRASSKSAAWCLQGVDQCWSEKERFIKADELASAKEAYEHARSTYRRLLAECQAAGSTSVEAKLGQ